MPNDFIVRPPPAWLARVPVLLLLLSSCATAPSTRRPPIPALDGQTIVARFPLAGASAVVVHAVRADGLLVERDDADAVTISGVADGYIDPVYLVGRPDENLTMLEWADLGFVGRRVGAELVIRAVGEFELFSHHYTFSHLRVSVPPGILVRAVGEKGHPDP